MASYYNNKHPKTYHVSEGVIDSFADPPPPYDEEKGPAPILNEEEEEEEEVSLFSGKDPRPDTQTETDNGKAQRSSNTHEEATTKKSWWSQWCVPSCYVLATATPKWENQDDGTFENEHTRERTEEYD